MEGKRFGIGLAAGILLALAIVTVSGGLGSTPFTGSFALNAASTPSTTTISTTTMVSTSTVATSTISMTTTVAPQTTSSTSMASVASTTTGGSASLGSNETYPSNSVSVSSTTVTSTFGSVSTTSSSTPGGQWAATAATNATPFGFLFPPGVNKPTQVASITRQPIITNAEILAPVLVAFLLGAFLYRITVQERGKPSGD